MHVVFYLLFNASFDSKVSNGCCITQLVEKFILKVATSTCYAVSALLPLVIGHVIWVIDNLMESWDILGIFIIDCDSSLFNYVACTSRSTHETIAVEYSTLNKFNLIGIWTFCGSSFIRLVSSFLHATCSEKSKS